MASCPGSVILDVSDITQRHIGVTIVILVRDEAFMGAKKKKKKATIRKTRFWRPTLPWIGAYFAVNGDRLRNSGLFLVSLL